MRIFTSVHFYKSVAVLMLLCTTSLVQAQFSHKLNISAPEAVAGSYDAQLGAFGPTICDVESLSGELLFVVDSLGGTLACDTVTNDLTGKIAVIDRGECNFSIKVYEAQKKGATGAIVVSNNPDQAIFAMAAGDFADLITIPAVMISSQDGETLRAAINAGGVMAELVKAEIEDAIWTSEFDGGLGDWTVRQLDCSGSATPEDLWIWDADGVSPDMACGGSELVSPTACNGVAMFLSNLLDDPGTVCGGAVGSGPCPAPQIAELISPMIDVSAYKGSGFSVAMYQSVRDFDSNYYIGWTIDGGTTWDSVAVNTSLPSGGNEELLLEQPLPGTVGADSLQFKIRYEANYYYWLVDDISLKIQTANDLRVNDNFFATAPNFQIPASQVEPFGFLADIENVGAADQTNVNLNVTVVNELSNVVYTDDLPYNTVTSNTLVENIPFNNFFTPPAVEGGYLGGYTVTADSADVNVGNNQQFFEFFVTDTTFAKEAFFAPTVITPSATNWDATEAHSAAYGNYFYVPNGEGNFIRSVSFFINNPDELDGRAVVVQIYKWLGDANGDAVADPEERESLGFNFHVLSAADVGQFITVPFPAAGEEPVELEDNTAYLVMVEYLTTDQVDMQMVFDEYNDYGATIFLSELLGVPRYGVLLGLNDDLTAEGFGTFGFGRESSPVVRFNVGSNPAVATEDLENIENEFTVYPNPAKESINLQLGLQETARTATVRMLDISGRELLVRQYDNVQREIFQYNVENMAAGTYMLQVTTEEGTGTRRFVVTKK